MLFFVAFGIKAAVFPLFFWLPAAYPTLPVAVSALFAGLLTKVGVYAMIRVFTLLFVGDTPFTHGLILWVAGLTMVTGVLGAVSQTEVRRILSFHIVSQIGYMVMGLGLYTPLGLAGSVFYIAHHIVVKTNLFLIAGLLARARGSFELARLGSLWHERPWLAALFLVPALSLAGLPPLSGFFAKVVLARAGLESGEFAVVAVAFAVSLLTLYSMTKIWSEAFWKRAPGPARDARFSPALVGPSVALAGLTLAIGILAGPLLDLSIAAAEGLLDRDGYTHAVLGER
jgi:multicomponent Na+:H+ antiporter subunit D